MCPAPALRRTMCSVPAVRRCLLVTALLLQHVVSYQLEVVEGPKYRMPAETVCPLTLRFLHNASDPQDVASLQQLTTAGTYLTVTAALEYEWQLIFRNSSATFSPEDISNGTNKTLAVSGYYWGYVPVFFYGIESTQLDTEFREEDDTDASTEDGTAKTMILGSIEDDMWLLRNDTMIIVDRKDSSKVVDTVFLLLATIFMLVNTVNMGCQLDLRIILAVLKKPVGPFCGIVAQFICMPLFSFCTGWLLLDNPLHRLGLFTLGCSPGGSASNLWTLLFNGDLNLSITMTFASTIIAMGMMPFWMLTLGSKLLGSESSIKIPYGNLATSLLALTIPVAIGLLIKYKKKNWAKLSEKIVKPMTFCMLLFIITVGIYNSHKSFALMTWRLVLAGFMVAFGGYSAGALMSLLFCLKKPQIIAISIETAFQNAAVAFLLLKLSLPTPDSDIAAVPVLAQLFETGPPLLTLYLVWQLLQKCGYCKIDPKEEKKEDINTDVSKSLMSDTPDELPRTPGLLFDPSMPKELKQSTDKLATVFTSSVNV